MKFSNLRTGMMPVFLAAVLALLMLAFWFGSCDATETDDSGTAFERPAVTTPPYERQSIDFFKGITEPGARDWQEMLRDAGRLLDNGFNTVTLSPPVFITPRAGGRPRVILEGEAASAESLIGDFQEKKLAVHVSPTTRAAGFPLSVEPTEAALGHLEEDALLWARKAEEHRAELFSPLSGYNQVLGTEAAGQWSSRVLPLIREEYQGEIGAKVVPDLDGPPEPGQPHDFEELDYTGYDYLMLDIFPRGESFDAGDFEAYVTGVLERADAVARRDGLKGVIVSEFGSWRKPLGAHEADGPVLAPDEQAQMAADFLEIAAPRTRGVFYQGWTLPARGARDHPVEEVLKDKFKD
ncbi:MAG: hypothetical protein IBX61_02170 [Thermoleophilia bacterium]|nr:hypothetical protein [Thermoleophilia bacterium]